MTDLRRMAFEIRRTIIRQSKRADIGHVGSCLSIADLMAALYGDILRIPAFDDPSRDRFVLSKGHAALTLYAALHAAGWLSEEALDSYCVNGSPLSGHPEHVLDGVELSTGSLGHGLSCGAGFALAGRLRRSVHRVFVLMSDAECNEGSVWEAAMFAAHHHLANLVAFVDDNGQQALGRTADVLDLEPLADRWRAFGWDARVVDGHDPVTLARTVEGLDTSDGPPHVLVARTVFGKGVSYMEGRIHWHYWAMSDGEFAQALDELEVAESLAVAPETVK
jgi:transketolase